MELILILAIGFAFLWFTSRRNRKQQAMLAEFRDSLAPGQEVVTRFGMYGTIVELDEETVTLETSPGSTSRWVRAAVDRLATPADETADDEAVDDEDLDDEDLDDEDLDDGEYDEYDDELDEDGTADADAAVVPDDASSLTTDPDAGDTPRR